MVVDCGNAPPFGDSCLACLKTALLYEHRSHQPHEYQETLCTVKRQRTTARQMSAQFRSVQPALNVDTQYMQGQGRKRSREAADLAEEHTSATM